MKRWRKIVLGIFVGLYAAVFIVLWSAQSYFSYTRPTHPDVALGRIWSINVNGTVVYLTHREYLLAGPPMIVAAACSFIVLALLAVVLGNPFSDS
jgi:hypothetical protein